MATMVFLILLVSSVLVYALESVPDRGVKTEVDLSTPNDDEPEYESRANEDDAVVHQEQDELGGSWFDDFEDESGVEWKENVSVENNCVNLGIVEINNWYEIYPSTHPTARICPSSTIFNTNKILLFGGATQGGGITDETWIFDFNTKEWTNMAPPGDKPGARENHATAPIYGTDKVLLFGGWDGTRLGDTWVYDLSENKWTNKNYPPGISERSSHDMTSIYGDDKVLLFGGTVGGGRTYIYDLSDNEWTRKYPQNHSTSEHNPKMASIYNDDKVILYGGDEGPNTWVYDLSDNEWTNKNPTNHPPGSSPNSYTEHGLTTIYGDDKVIYYYSQDTWIYDLSDNQWYNKNPPSFPSSRSWMDLAMVDGTDEIILFGGAGELNDTWIYDYKAIFPSGFLVSDNISRPNREYWDILRVSKTEPANTYINISIINTSSNTTIPGFDKLTNRTINISELNEMGITSFRLKAYFSGNGSVTPSLYSWGVEWNKSNAWRDSFTGGSKVAYPYGVDEHTVGYWKFEEGVGNVARDLSGNGNDGNITGATFQKGIGENALHFASGTQDRLEIPILPAITQGTIELWFKLDVDHTVSLIKKFLFDCHNIYPQNFTHCLLQDSDGHVEWAVKSDNWKIMNSTQDYWVANEWHYLTCLWNSSGIQLWIDAECVENSSDVITVQSYPWIFGNSGGFEYPLSGTIDEVRISNVARTPEEIREAYQASIAIHGGQVQLGDNEVVPDGNTSALWHFNEGEGNVLHDSSGNENDGVIYGANWTEGIIGGALEFDGLYDYVEVSNSDSLNITDKITIEAWIYPRSEQEEDFGGIVCHISGDSSSRILWSPSERKLLAQVKNEADQYNNLRSPFVTPNEWHHIVYVYNGFEEVFYIDGINGTPMLKTGKLRTGLYNIKLGALHSSVYYLNGTIDEVAFYNRALTASEIRAHANRYHHNATLRSVPITLPANNIWSTFHCNRTVGENTYLNITIHDAKTNETLLWDYTRTDDLTLNFSEINSSEHTSIYLQAYFQSNSTETPVLYDWAVNWTLTYPPELYEYIANRSFNEDTMAQDVLELSNHFRDINAPPSGLSFSIERVGGGQHINATTSDTLVSFRSDTANWSGDESFKIICSNELNKSTESNIFSIFVTPIDDRPMWKSPIRDITVAEDNHSESINLTELVEDAENDPIDFTFSINETGVDINISQGSMTIIPDNNWFGALTVEMTVYQISNSSLNSTTSFDVKVTSENDLPITHLIYPKNGSAFNTRKVTLNWSSSDVDESVENLCYYVYISKDLEQVVSISETVRSITDNTNITFELDYGTYYWTVVGFDELDLGICTDGYYTFSLTNITIPEVELLSPSENSTVNTLNVTLTWKSLDIDDITYILYFGNSSDELKIISELNGSEYLITGLPDNKTYYWKVCAKLNNITGICASGVWPFTVDTSFTPSYLIEVEVNTRQLEVIQGNDIQFSLNITNVGNMETFVKINVSGSLQQLIELPKNINLSAGEFYNITVTIESSALSIGSYDLIIKFDYTGGAQNLPISLKVISGEPIEDDDDDTDADGDQGLSGMAIGLIVGGIVLVLIVIFVVFIVLRKKKKEKDEPDLSGETTGIPQEAVQRKIPQTPSQSPVTPKVSTGYYPTYPQQVPPSVTSSMAVSPPIVETTQEDIQPPADESEPLLPPSEETLDIPPVVFEPTIPEIPLNEPPAPEVTPREVVLPPSAPPISDSTVPALPLETKVAPSTYKDFISAESTFHPITTTMTNIVPNYTITHKIGAGGFGTVYKAFHVSGKNVAIKLPKMLDETIDASVLQKFQDEADIWRKLRHKNIVEFIDGNIVPCPYLAIELMEGGNLKQLVSKYQLSIGEAVYVMAQVLDGMGYAHLMATIHRDLKPENILFTKDGIPKISDWGIGKFMGSMSTDKTIGMKGTMLYSAPEQISKAKFGQVDWTTDIFQLGIVFYEMITRQHPFFDEDPVGIIGKITGENPRPPSEINPMIPKELDNIIMTALEKEKEKRWRSADIMHHELKKLIEG